MEKQKNKNYADDVIPCPAELVKEAELLIQNIREITKYTFSELFTETENKGRNEYYRNNSIWQKEIEYNTWDKNELKKLEKVQDERKEMNEVKGLYIFYEDDKPVYVGISRLILKRLKHHFLGKVHNEATLVYLMLRHKHDRKGRIYDGLRSDLQIFKDERESKQEEMRKKWKIAIIPQTNNYKMYFFEIYLACYLKTEWNSFETH